MLSQQLLTQFATGIFTPLKKGECASCMFVAGGGKRTLLKHFLTEKTTLKAIFGEMYSKTLFVYVDPDEISNVTTEAYVQLLLDNLIQTLHENKFEVKLELKATSPLALIKKYLEHLSTEDWRVIFILNDFEFTLSLPVNIYLNLESIMAVDKSKIVYLFLSTVNLFSENTIHNFHNLKYAVSRNIVYFPLFNRDEAFKLIQEAGKKLQIPISQKFQEALYECCGGHPQLLKYTINNLKSIEKLDFKNCDEMKLLLANDHQLMMVCSDIWNFLNPTEKEMINSVVANGSFNSIHQEEVTYFLRLGLINETSKKKYKVFGVLFEGYVKKKLPKHKISYDTESKKLYCSHISCDEKFTHQEYKLLIYLLAHENEVVTRDQVAEAMWGRLYLEKYSDWSIDKTISILRKKLDALGFPSEYLVTLKKRGFSFSNPV